MGVGCGISTRTLRPRVARARSWPVSVPPTAGNPARRCIEKGAWLAYFRDDDGQVRPVRDPEAGGRDEDWLGLEFSSYFGPRLPLRVLSVTNRSPRLSEERAGKVGEDRLAGLRDLLVTALFRTRRFDIQDEFDGEGGPADGTSPSWDDGPRRQRAAPAEIPDQRYVVYGTVHEWIPERSRLEVERRSGGSLRVRRAELTLTIVLADSRSGVILFSAFESARIVVRRDLRQREGGESQWIDAAPSSRALQICFNKAAFGIASFLRSRKWRGSVLQVKGREVIINAGTQQGIEVGEPLTALSRTGEVVDTDGVTVLGELLRGMGSLRVVSVSQSYSIAWIEEGCQGIKPGDRIELVREPSALAIPADCASRGAG